MRRGRHEIAGRERKSDLFRRAGALFLPGSAAIPPMQNDRREKGVMRKWFLKLVVGFALSISLAIFVRSEAFGELVILPLLGEEAAETSPFDALPTLIEMAKKNMDLRERDLALKEQAAQQSPASSAASIAAMKELGASPVLPAPPPAATNGAVRVRRGTGEDAVPVNRGS